MFRSCVLVFVFIFQSNSSERDFIELFSRACPSCRLLYPNFRAQVTPAMSIDVFLVCPPFKLTSTPHALLLVSTASVPSIFLECSKLRPSEADRASWREVDSGNSRPMVHTVPDLDLVLLPTPISATPVTRFHLRDEFF
ncbi:hypothetical protein C8J57DRAFT_78722 [Mycena rebaudengoi]|nr:hypothetical protein C8J57DRAFT_78722 [Mycena rebaudengoi]